ncbi:MAG: LytTR family DNA-binding domain-containing protein [Bacteroidota bacterium]
MKILIIEDEEPASDRLKKMVNAIIPHAEITTTIASVSAAVKWFQKHPCPDLVLMDIQLSDGNSFDIFKEVKVECPIIFTTAFDEYAIKAFKLNSVDYLLKPIKKEELAAAIKKYESHVKQPSADYSKLIEMISSTKEKHQKRILIRFRDIIKTIELVDVAYFFVENKITYAKTKQNMQYQVDYNLDEIEELTDSQIFFRINRQCIINIEAIEKMAAYTKSRVKLILAPPSNLDTIVSTERSPEFKTWLLGKS